jgi:hypothetical protein
LSDRLPPGSNYYYGLFLNDEIVGFQCFSNYTPHRKGTKKIYHFNRTVIHPDYVGFGLGGKVINITSKIMAEKGFRVMAKFSSIPVYKTLMKDKHWVYLGSHYSTKGGTCNMKRTSGFRDIVKFYKFEYKHHA